VKTFATLLAAALALPCLLDARAAGCSPGVYARNEQERVAIAAPPAGGGGSRYVFLDGRRGHLGTADSLVRCDPGGPAAQGADGSWQPWPQVALTRTAARFRSHGTELRGELIEPAPQEGQGRPPLVVYVHGSEKTAALGTSYPYLLAAQGLAVFVYDKRGTGSSEGFYTQNFELLADDAAAALQEARRLAAGRHGRAGFAGFSQGGWVAPLAARRSAADFVAVGFGLLLTPLEEDQEQVLEEMRRAGHDAAALVQAREVTAATGAVIASHFTSGFARLAAVKQRYAGKPWLAQIEGEHTGQILRMDEASLRRIGPPLLDGLDVIWRYDGEAVLKGLDVPLLWIIAGEDREAPGDVTRERLLALRRAGKAIELYLYPETDHGMLEYVQAPDGSRAYTRVTEGYLRLLGDWIRGRSLPPYGRGQRLF
jgi:pimeloyl-ACP methyl ester carboxylesterase